jgi:hypothetical protein
VAVLFVPAANAGGASAVDASETAAIEAIEKRERSEPIAPSRTLSSRRKGRGSRGDAAGRGARRDSSRPAIKFPAVVGTSSALVPLIALIVETIDSIAAADEKDTPIARAAHCLAAHTPA